MFFSCCPFSSILLMTSVISRVHVQFSLCSVAKLSVCCCPRLPVDSLQRIQLQRSKSREGKSGGLAGEEPERVNWFSSPVCALCSCIRMCSSCKRPLAFRDWSSTHHSPCAPAGSRSLTCSLDGSTVNPEKFCCPVNTPVFFFLDLFYKSIV